MKASCIIPVYNAEKTLRRCVESLVYGEEQDLEIILVEDCSKDESWKLCQKLSTEFSNVRCFQNSKNSGVSYTRNHGLQEAKGEYILFVDSDDWVSGRYAATLLSAAVQYPDRLVISGFSFYDFHTNQESLYVLDQNTPETAVEPAEYFRLVNASLIQSPCNKIFRRQFIDAAQIQFDVNQSMGEDFQFVLDYLRTSGATGCQVLNDPLYYYIRANDSSLMSKFGVTGFNMSADRLQQLAILGNIPESELQNQLQKLKENYLYHICRYKPYNKAQKLSSIEVIMQDGHAASYYRKSSQVKFLEQLSQSIHGSKVLIQRIRGRCQREKQSRLIKHLRAGFTGSNFTIISQNCIGGVFYHDMNLPFLSPTINLYFKAEDFLKFVCNLRKYLQMDLQMHWEERYPVGTLDDITIYFQHYSSCTEAKAAWERRKKRILWDKILILSTDHEGFHADSFRQWKQIPYPKILFSSQKQFAEDKHTIYYPEYESNGCVPDLISRREFYKNGTLMELANQFKS